MGEGRRAAVLGRPIEHSLSPVIHRAGYAALGMADWSYEAVDCGEHQLDLFLARLNPSWAGLSLTMPLKELALEIADCASAAASALGAANTLLPRDGGWYADNTDVGGMVDAIRAVAPVHPERHDVDTVAILGAGGTARAALGAAAAMPATDVTCYARRPDAADEALGPVARHLGLDLTVLPWMQASRAVEADLVISTVPAGGADDLAGAAWRSGGLLLDVVYDPWPTPVTAAAADAGCRIVPGLEMLLMQAVRQFTLFTGVEHPPVPAMRAAMEEAVAARGR
jgi:shikimate dehydrogenase